MTRALAPRLKHGAKVALISSRMGSIGDNGSGGYYGYRMSKAALNAAGVSLAHELRPSGVALVVLHPGAVRTDMTKHTGMIDAQEPAHGLLERIDDLRLETTGPRERRSLALVTGVEVVLLAYSTAALGAYTRHDTVASPDQGDKVRATTSNRIRPT